MKIIQRQLKEIIKEEIEIGQSELLDAIKSLAVNIEDLDVSIDFLASAMTGVAPYSLKQTQKTLGRAAHAPSMAMSPREIEEIIREETIALLKENGYLSNIYKWCPAGTACKPGQQQTNWWKGK